MSEEEKEGSSGRSPDLADDQTISEQYLGRSYPEAHGRNVVNVIVVDFRGFDTMGEITVLIVAALGIASLVGLGRTRGGDASIDDADLDGSDGPLGPDEQAEESDAGPTDDRDGGDGEPERRPDALTPEAGP